MIYRGTPNFFSHFSASLLSAEVDEEPGGLGRSDEGREFFGRGRADFLHRTEMAQQELYGLRADSFDIFQFTVNESFASLLPVEGDAEAMGFVADVTHHFERFTVRLK